MSWIPGSSPGAERSTRGARRARGIGVVLGCLLLTVACGEDPESTSGTDQDAETSRTSETTPSDATPSEDTTPTEDTASTEDTTTAAPGTKIDVGDSEFGEMLFDDTGQAIYLFDVETTAEPRCYDECAEAWPPVYTEGEPVAGDGVDPELLGTTERADGQLQVTYNDHPLYFYAHEEKFEVLCHDVFLNGGNWYVVQPGGDAAPPG